MGMFITIQTCFYECTCFAFMQFSMLGFTYLIYIIHFVY